MWRRSSFLKTSWALLLITLACGSDALETDTVGPVVVVGIDGGSWNVIEELWQRGELPHFRQLADSGFTAKLRPIADYSPVIWTSMATGVAPKRHGITNFVVPTATGDVPVSSTVRKVPAVWNMVSTAARKVAVLGWWASWPAEPVNGVVITDRSLRDVENHIYPPDYDPEFQEIARSLRDKPDGDPDAAIFLQDQAVAAVAKQLITEDYDLLLVYLRFVDTQSHRFWRYFVPERRDSSDPESVAEFGDRIPAAYAWVDEVLGELMRAAGPSAVFFVVSDHGFRETKGGESYRIWFDIDRVLEHLGYLDRQGEEIDYRSTRAQGWQSPKGLRTKMIRFARSDREPYGPVQPQEIGDLAQSLTDDLSRLTYESGAPVLQIGEPRRRERERGGDLVAVVQHADVSQTIYFEGEPIPDAISNLYEISGSHSRDTRGIFLAAGPGIDRDAKLSEINALDITPTILYAMDLPVAEDFDGEARMEIFQRRHRRQHEVQTIASWGARQTTEAATSEVDSELIEELRALGYLD
jgi:predicted AlkP superfamily phosphohydrolase/phosphomutase